MMRSLALDSTPEPRADVFDAVTSVLEAAPGSQRTSLLVHYERLASALIEPLLQRAAAGAVVNLHDAASYHLGARGKRFRSALTCLAGEPLGAAPEDLAAIGAAVELAHEASLVHDDIQDGDRERRGQPAAWAKFGVPHAINLGDYLVVQSFAALSAMRAESIPSVLPFFASRLAALAEGQAEDLNLRIDTAPSEDRYLSMVRRKTVPLIDIALVAPALACAAPAPAVRSLARFSDAIGIVFQVRDDVLEIRGRKNRRLATELVQGARSFVVCHAYRMAKGADRAELSRLLSTPPPLASGDVDRLLEIVEATGAVSEARSFVGKLAEDAAASDGVLPRELGEGLRQVLLEMLAGMP